MITNNTIKVPWYDAVAEGCVIAKNGDQVSRARRAERFENGIHVYSDAPGDASYPIDEDGLISVYVDVEMPNLLYVYPDDTYVVEVGEMLRYDHTAWEWLAPKYVVAGTTVGVWRPMDGDSSEGDGIPNWKGWPMGVPVRVRLRGES